MQDVVEKRDVSEPVLLITEIFRSLQGEGSHTGLPYTFVRLTGCNLRCRYCDTAYAFKGGTRMALPEVIEEVQRLGERRVLLTGGEPLLQRPLSQLLEALSSRGFEVSIETHGEADLTPVAGRARIIMDVKTPDSDECRGGYEQNLPLLKKTDEVKFVICSEKDYAFARDLVRSGKIPCTEILFSAARPAPGAPGTVPGVELPWLAERILEDKLPVRLQTQLHKLIWGDRGGV